MSDTARLGLPLLAQSQAQKHITHNQALFMLDMVAQASIKSSQLTMPPDNPVEGDCYLIASAGEDDWLGQDNNLAYWTAEAWLFASPKEGWLLWDENQHRFMLFHNGNWRANGHVPEKLSGLSRLGILTEADDVNRLSVKSDAALFSHDDVTPGNGDVRFTVNKKSEQNSATFVFQNSWQGHAEIGLAGDNHFSFKTSPDGASWSTALRLNRHNGQVEMPQGCKANGPMQMAETAMANLPDATQWPAGLIYVSDAPSGSRPAFSDGSIWRWLHDLSPIV